VQDKSCSGCNDIVLTNYLLLPHKGWSYHAVPTFFGILFIISFLITECELFVSKNINGYKNIFRFELRRYQVCLILLAVIFIFFGGGKTLRDGVAPIKETPITRVLSKYSKENDYIVFVSTSEFPAFPTLLQMNRKIGSRYSIHDSIAFIEGLKNKDPEYARKQEEKYFNELAEDITNFRPRLIFIDDSGASLALPRGFNIKKYFTGKGFIDHAMKDYRLIIETPTFKNFASLTIPSFSVYLLE
jgi:hypothetical protein